MKKRKLIIAITGASGQIYAKRLLEKLNKFSTEIEEIAVCFTDSGLQVYKFENEEELQAVGLIKIYNNKDLFAPMASGSQNYDTMIVVPASMGTIARIANGYANDLIARAADVVLKENQQLIIVPRETPYNKIHLRNLSLLADAGAIILPASPSFYHKPATINDLVDTVVERILKHINIDAEIKVWKK